MPAVRRRVPDVLVVPVEHDAKFKLTSNLNLKVPALRALVKSTGSRLIVGSPKQERQGKVNLKR